MISVQKASPGNGPGSWNRQTLCDIFIVVYCVY
ncbi:rCG46242 [Rattus norvegicus]|uniref:RCG46242 n=1 Tax=Rattus norvegicus TaxID=10116 RepID=A6IDL1_RAT|nr:rCG46242 [Rattus norvegicus]